MQVRGMLTERELAAEIESGAIDTVIVATCDMQGRLIGKRVSGWYFLEHAREHGTHFCTYLLGTDIELETPAGYELMTWESGYGDYQARPDWGTARRIPWLEGTALVLADVVDEATGEEIPVSPRTLLKQQVERCRSLGFEPKMASELEFYLFDESFRAIKAKDYQNFVLGGDFNEDYQLLQGTKYEPFYRLLRNQLTEAGVPIEFSKGEAAVAQHEINIHYGNALEAADRTVLLKHGIKEMAIQNEMAVTFMAKPDAGWTGSSGHVHCSLASLETGESLFSDLRGRIARPHALVSGRIAGRHPRLVFVDRAERQLLQALCLRKLGAGLPDLVAGQSHLRVPHRRAMVEPAHGEPIPRQR